MWPLPSRAISPYCCSLRMRTTGPSSGDDEPGDSGPPLRSRGHRSRWPLFQSLRGTRDTGAEAFVRATRAPRGSFHVHLLDRVRVVHDAGVEGTVDETERVPELVQGLLLAPLVEEDLVLRKSVELLPQPGDRKERRPAIDLGLAEDVGQDRDEKVHVGHPECPRAPGNRQVGETGQKRRRVELLAPGVERLTRIDSFSRHRARAADAGREDEREIVQEPRVNLPDRNELYGRHRRGWSRSAIRLLPLQSVLLDLAVQRDPIDLEQARRLRYVPGRFAEDPLHVQPLHVRE